MCPPVLELDALLLLHDPSRCCVPDALRRYKRQPSDDEQEAVSNKVVVQEAEERSSEEQKLVSGGHRLRDCIKDHDRYNDRDGSMYMRSFAWKSAAG